MPSRARRSTAFALCIQSGEDDSDLIVGKVYQVMKPEQNDRSSDIRIVDESREDYLYPRAWFVPVALPPKARKALVATR
jgi:hypothetical protein